MLGAKSKRLPIGTVSYCTFGPLQLPAITLHICVGPRSRTAEGGTVKRHPFRNWTWEGSVRYMGDVIVVVSDTFVAKTVGFIVKEYESVAGANINAEKSVGSQLGTWRGRVRVLDCFMGI